MLQTETFRNGRAGECWGLGHAYSDFWPRHGAWASLDTDDYIFPRRAIDIEDQASRAALLAHCRNALCATFERAWATAPDIAARHDLTARLTSLDAEDALRAGRVIGGDWYAAPAGKQNTDSAALLDAVGVLDDLHARLLDGREIEHDTLALARIAFHAGFNPVAVCADAIGDAELLTVAAWLGMIHRGRRAIMPRFVAAYWLMLLGDAKDWPVSSYAPDAFLFEQAASVLPFASFRDKLGQAMSSGPLSIGAPGSTAAPASTSRAIPLFSAIAASAKALFTLPTQSSRGAH